MSRTGDTHYRVRAVFEEALLQDPLGTRGVRPRCLRAERTGARMAAAHRIQNPGAMTPEFPDAA
jgi:hypothetical protein